ncbi:MAG: ion transporter [Acidimicrobiaceae bacterium]|nr:ion transporter [Acidimicrobiaceae bacterium]MXZ99145.1 ion transporter [Acidimicrobiaceae bacterium]MYE75964.1 ion transporter [Acidimicrobiaceae bacterium]MYE98320.1 ion transporter [Acidimicrobiaceae bacterium]MYH44268.1 ion transporter [Acidimicrobiaceae bacterium]
MTSSRPVQLFEAGTRRGRSMEVAAGLVVALSLVPLIVYTEVGDAAWIVWADRAFWALFTVEYAARLVTARERVRYARSFYGIVDLLAVLSGVASLPALASVKVLRLLRVLRVLKLARYSSAVDRFSRAFADIKDELALYTGVTAVISFMAAYGIWHFEHSLNEAYGNLFECVYWSVASLTMGAEGIAPVTAPGKVLAMLLVLLGLGIVAVPSGLLASALSKTGSDVWAAGRDAATETPGER